MPTSHVLNKHREEMLQNGHKRNIAVFPRACIQRHSGFIQWAKAGPIVRNIEKTFTWMLRDEAEKSRDWIQPIPCALIYRDGCYTVLKRVEGNKRLDLSSRISLLVGGHVDECPEKNSLLSLLRVTLRRELNEELGIEEPPVKRVGIVIDSSSLTASMHVAFVYKVAVTREVINALAFEEFLLRSRLTGRFFSPTQLHRFYRHFDPWSSILFEDYIAGLPFPNRKPRQLAMPWFL